MLSMESYSPSGKDQLKSQKENLQTLKKSAQQNMERLETGDFGKELLTEIEKGEKINLLEKNIYRIESLIKIVDLELKKFEEQQKIQELEKIKNSFKTYQEQISMAKERKTDTESKIQDFQKAENSKKEINLLIEEFKKKYQGAKLESLNLGNIEDTFNEFKVDVEDLSKKIEVERKNHLESFNKTKIEKEYLSGLAEDKLLEEQRLINGRLSKEYPLISKEEETKRKNEYQRRIEVIESILKEREAEKLKTEKVEATPEPEIAIPQAQPQPTVPPRERAQRQSQEAEVTYPPHIRNMALQGVLEFLKNKEETGKNPNFIAFVKANLENILKKIIKESSPQGSSIKLFKEEEIAENTNIVLNEILTRVNEGQTQAAEIRTTTQTRTEPQVSETIIPRVVLGRETQNTSQPATENIVAEEINQPQASDLNEETKPENSDKTKTTPESSQLDEIKIPEIEDQEKNKLIKPEIESNVVNFNGNETISFKNLKPGPLNVDILLVKNGGIGSINLKKYLEKGENEELVVNIEKLVKDTKISYIDIDYINVNFQNTAIYTDFTQFMYCLKQYEENNPEAYKK